LIAASPAVERDASRLLVYHRKSRKVEHRPFTSLPEYLSPSDLLVFNDTRVFPARLYARKKSGGLLELLLLRSLSGPGEEEGRLNTSWEALVRGKAPAPLDLIFSGGATGRIHRDLEGGRKELLLSLPSNIYRDIYSFLEQWGEVPLPPYIVRKRGTADRVAPSDQDRYQTVYAEKWGSVAAPTAGLHFSERLLEEIKAKGIQTAAVTLHIGLDTFQPIRTEKLDDHVMHREWFDLPASTAEAIHESRKKRGRVVAVGTTVTRVLESISQPDGTVQAGSGETGLFITPGYHFNGIDALLTNFHLPKSTLLVLVSAFAGVEAVRALYEEAIREKYRFYSYGDAMLIL
jgi:S-adenosylmethionine:tRNA ribosyltransferase-isomerase